MRSLLVWETLFDLVVLGAGVGWVLLRRRRVGRATRPAVCGLVLLAVAMLVGNGWTLRLLNLAETGPTDDLWAFARWTDLAGAFTEMAALAGILALTVSIFVGRSAEGER